MNIRWRKRTQHIRVRMIEPNSTKHYPLTRVGFSFEYQICCHQYSFRPKFIPNNISHNIMCPNKVRARPSPSHYCSPLSRAKHSWFWNLLCRNILLRIWLAFGRFVIKLHAPAVLRASEPPGLCLRRIKGGGLLRCTSPLNKPPSLVGELLPHTPSSSFLYTLAALAP